LWRRERDVDGVPRRHRLRSADPGPVARHSQAGAQPGTLGRHRSGALCERAGPRIQAGVRGPRPSLVKGDDGTVHPALHGLRADAGELRRAGPEPPGRLDPGRVATHASRRRARGRAPALAGDVLGLAPRAREVGVSARSPATGGAAAGLIGATRANRPFPTTVIKVVLPAV